MSLIITFMFEPAKLQMNWAKASGASTRASVFAGARGPLLSQPACLHLGTPSTRRAQPSASEGGDPVGGRHARTRGLIELGIEGEGGIDE